MEQDISTNSDKKISSLEYQINQLKDLNKKLKGKVEQNETNTKAKEEEVNNLKERQAELQSNLKQTRTELQQITKEREAERMKESTSTLRIQQL